MLMTPVNMAGGVTCHYGLLNTCKSIENDSIISFMQVVCVCFFIKSIWVFSRFITKLTQACICVITLWHPFLQSIYPKSKIIRYILLFFEKQSASKERKKSGVKGQQKCLVALKKKDNQQYEKCRREGGFFFFF